MCSLNPRGASLSKALSQGHTGEVLELLGGYGIQEGIRTTIW